MVLGLLYPPIGRYVSSLSFKDASTSLLMLVTWVGDACSAKDSLQGYRSQSYESLPVLKYHNALFRMNFHMTPHVPIEVSNSFKLGNSFSSSVAKRYVDALSDIIIRGSDF